jgi:hypothetical protein
MPTAVLRRTAAQVFMVGIPGPSLDAATRAFLVEYAPGGIVLFANVRSATSPPAGAGCALGAGVPPLVMIDHGATRRSAAPAPVRALPRRRSWVPRGMRGGTRRRRAMGRELAAIAST